MAYIHRQIEPLLRKSLETFASVVISGPRQSGKSTLVQHILPDYRYFSFDDPLTRERAAADPRLFLETAGERMILDEIQWLPGLLPYIKADIDKRRDQKGRFVLTGSQQFSLMKNLADSLAGRIAILELLPFSWKEKQSVLPLRTSLDAFCHAGMRGSYPELVVNPDLDALTWFGAYVQTYLERDIRSLYNIGSLRDFQRFLQLLAGRCAQTVNLSRLATDLGVNAGTIRAWLSILEAGRIIFLLPPFYSNLGKRITKAPKVYFLDIGLISFLTGIHDQTHLLQGPLAGALFENFCIQETVNFFLQRGRRPNIYFLRTNNGMEVDLLIERSFETVVPIEIKLSKTPSLFMATNLSRFRRLFDRFSIEKGIIVSLAEESHPLNENTLSLALADYLEQLSSWLDPHASSK